MKKICFTMLLSSSIAFGSNVIELTGEYTKNLGNPFRVIFEKKRKILVFFQPKKILR